MEFNAIVDAKVQNPTGCAVLGVYENGELGPAGKRMNAQLNGLITKLHGDGDFSGKLGDVLMLPSPAGVSAASAFLIQGVGHLAPM